MRRELSGNVGEWSEVYTFLKLLSDGILYGADKDINKINDLYYNIVAVLRNINEQDHYNYERKDKINISSSNNDFTPYSVEIKEFKENAKILFDVIKNSSGSFEVNEIKSFLEKINCITLKAPSQDKSDIQIKIHDPLLSAEPTLGFSIKSQIGSPSTLLNASGTTNFLYELVGDLSDEEIEEINSFRLFKDKFNYLENKNISLEFIKVDNDAFNNNLMLIESKMSFILSKILLYYYSGIFSELKDLIEICSEKDICNTNRNNLFYEIKIKDFLMSVALGMKPGTPWNGLYEATGGYLIVKETGEILCYHIYNRNDLRDYLFNNTKLDTPSRTKHGFGNIYKEKGKLYLKLNLQIRFLR